MAHYCFLLASEFASSFAFFVQLQSRVAFYACLMKHNLWREGDPGWECPRLEDPGLGDPGLVNHGWECHRLVDPGVGDSGLVNPGWECPRLVDPGLGDPGVEDQLSDL